ncbi:MAG: hypothetical protein QOI61_123 [Actinomycetota bacterium]
MNELIATRGPRLALRRTETELTVTAVDAQGRTTKLVTFASDDLDGAFDELDALYVAQGGVDYSAFRQRHAARDWDGFAKVFEPDAIIDDHRRAGWGAVSLERDIEFLQATVAMAGDSHVEVRHEIARKGMVLFIEQANVGTLDDGGPYELPHYTVFVASPRGRIAHSDLFDIDDFDAAQACFDAAVAAQRR